MCARVRGGTKGKCLKSAIEQNYLVVKHECTSIGKLSSRTAFIVRVRLRLDRTPMDFLSPARRLIAREKFFLSLKFADVSGTINTPIDPTDHYSGVLLAAIVERAHDDGRISRPPSPLPGLGYETRSPHGSSSVCTLFFLTV